MAFFSGVIYNSELEMLGSFKHPHPGRMFWVLYYPYKTEVDHDMNNGFIDNSVIAYGLLAEMIHVIKRIFPTSETLKNIQIENNQNTNKQITKSEVKEKNIYLRSGIVCFLSSFISLFLGNTYVDFWFNFGWIIGGTGAMFVTSLILSAVFAGFAEVFSIKNFKQTFKNIFFTVSVVLAMLVLLGQISLHLSY
jgi:hypothetical protein